eukprot:scaffold5143_cov119-Isochrysis_galbana.AAC.4
MGGCPGMNRGAGGKEVHPRRGAPGHLETASTLVQAPVDVVFCRAHKPSTAGMRRAAQGRHLRLFVRAVCGMAAHLDEPPKDLRLEAVLVRPEATSSPSAPPLVRRGAESRGSAARLGPPSLSWPAPQRSASADRLPPQGRGRPLSPRARGH